MRGSCAHMFLRESRQKRADGSSVAYLQLAESVWEPTRKRARTRIIYNVGRGDDPATRERLRRLARSIMRKCSPEEILAANPQWKLVDAWPHGDVYVIGKLWERLGLGETLTRMTASTRFSFSVERALFMMVANRACAPSSKLYCYEQWMREDVRIEGAEHLELAHLYRAMDFLQENRESIERELFLHISDLLNLEVDLIFYDTTSLHFEVDEEDRGVGQDDTVQGSKQAGGKQYKALRRRGHSKNGRKDAPQVVIGLAVTRDGLPVRHWVFPGNTADVTTVQRVKEDLRGWKLGRCVFVGDAGMVSAQNLRTLSLGGGKYIVCMPMRRGDEVTREVLARPGRYRKVADNLRVKLVVVGDGERRRRYVVCHNPQEQERQRAHRAKVLEELEAELSTLRQSDGRQHSKRTCELRSSGRYGHYLRVNRRGELEIDKARVLAEHKFDGKYVVHSNDDTLSAEDLALGYKQLMRVEAAWRDLKSGLRMRPVFHWAPHRICAHVSITVLSLLLERVAERACQDTWRNIRDDLRQIKLGHLRSPDGDVWQVTDPGSAASERLRALDLPNPAPIVAVR